MAHIAELVGVTSAEVLGTASFYEMFKRKPVGRYLVNVCTNISCQLLGGEELLEHAERTLGITAGSTTSDGLFTLEDVECIAACTEAPACQVNYRYVHDVSPEDFDALIADLREGRRDDIPSARHPGQGAPGPRRRAHRQHLAAGDAGPARVDRPPRGVGGRMTDDAVTDSSAVPPRS